MGAIEVKDQAASPGNPSAGFAKIYPKSNGLWYGLTAAGVETQLTNGTDSVEVSDINDPSAELNGLAGSSEGAFIKVFQVTASANNPVSLYSWDLSPAGAENVPLTVDGLGGQWVRFVDSNQSVLITESAARQGTDNDLATFSSLRVRQNAESVTHDGVPFAFHLGADNTKLDAAKPGENWAVAVEAFKIDDPKPIKVFAFDDTVEEGVGLKNPTYIPPKTTGIRTKLMSRAATAPPAERRVGLKLYLQRFTAGGPPTPTWDAGQQLSDIIIPSGSDEWIVGGGVTKLSDLSLAPGDFIRLEFTRVLPTTGINLPGDWKLLLIGFEFTQEEIL